MTLGSLFDGSGTCPLAATLCGITPVWASEIEPFPVAVTTKRFPNMKHLGDLTKINGAEIDPVDIITFGSPCQDLSIAGKRAGLNGNRSSLFFHAIRIVKEMKEKTNGQYPRFAVYENVLGAFSSNNGEDFREVLRQFCKICDSSADVPQPEKGKWLHDGCIMGEGYSVAWRVLDSQYWGVPQRRRRVYAVLDLTGGCAPKVLFERAGLQRNHKSLEQAWQAAASNSAECPTGNDSLVGLGCGSVRVAFENHAQDARYTQLDNICPTLTARYGTGGNNMPIVTEKPSCFCLAGNVVDRSEKSGANGLGVADEVSYTLNTADRHCVAYSFDSLASNSMKSKNPFSGCREVEVAKTIDTSYPDPSKNQGGIAIIEPGSYTLQMRSGCEGGGKGALVQTEKSATLSTVQTQTLFVRATGAANAETCENLSPTLTCSHDGAPILFENLPPWIVRRLTPQECAMLQGFPADWAADVPHSDTAEYKMWGNGMALPCMLYIMEGLSAELSKEAENGTSS